MRLDELKYHIVNKEILPGLLIFKYRKGSINSKFLFHQYLNEYSKNSDMEIIVEEDINKFISTGLFSGTIQDTNIHIYEIPNLEFLPEIQGVNLWILCNSVQKKVKGLHEDRIVELVSLEEWQIKDYINFNLPSLSEQKQNKLYSNYKSDLFRLELEIDKLKLVESDTEEWYNTIEPQLFVDATEYNIFDITNCILRRDKERLLQLRDEVNLIDIDPFGFIKILLTNFKYVIDIQLAKNSTPEYVGVSSKQFWAIKNHSCYHYSKDELVYIYKFLLSLDGDIKKGRMPIDIVVDYVISKIMLIERL